MKETIPVADKKFFKRFWSKVNFGGSLSFCWSWTAHIDDRGYGRFKLKDGYQAVASRISYILNFGEIPDGLCVCHRCDNPACVNPLHLFLGTFADNNMDKTVKGRNNAPQGEAHGRRSLSESQARDIYGLKDSGLKQCEVAIRYGVSDNAIGRIWKQQLWRCLHV